MRMRGVCAAVLGLGLVAVGAEMAPVATWAASGQAAPDANPAAKPTHPKHAVHRREASQPAPAPETQTAPIQSEPEKPKWPVNEAANPAYVRWDSQGLKISAFNSSLSEILNQVSNETGAKIEGVGEDERVFGDYGPGKARDVLSQLLHGGPYDYIVLGDQGQGTPREIILSKHHEGGPAQPGTVSRQAQENQEDDYQAPEQDDPGPQPPVFRPQQMAPPRTPQQRFEEMRQRQQQMQQQMQQQPQQPEQQQPPPPQ